MGRGRDRQVTIWQVSARGFAVRCAVDTRAAQFDACQKGIWSRGLCDHKCAIYLKETTFRFSAPNLPLSSSYDHPCVTSVHASFIYTINRSCDPRAKETQPRLDRFYGSIDHPRSTRASIVITNSWSRNEPTLPHRPNPTGRQLVVRSPAKRLSSDSLISHMTNLVKNRRVQSSIKESTWINDNREIRHLWRSPQLAVEEEEGRRKTIRCGSRADGRRRDERVRRCINCGARGQ